MAEKTHSDLQIELDGFDKSEHEVQSLPEILHGRSQDDLVRLGRKATFKLDLIIMPAMTILYVCSGRCCHHVLVNKLTNECP